MVTVAVSVGAELMSLSARPGAAGRACGRAATFGSNLCWLCCRAERYLFADGGVSLNGAGSGRGKGANGRWVDGMEGEWMEGWMEGRMGGWMDEGGEIDAMSRRNERGGEWACEKEDMFVMFCRKDG